MYCSQLTIETAEKEKMNARYKFAKTIKGTQQYHYVKPVPGTRKVITKYVSTDKDEYIANVSH